MKLKPVRKTKKHTRVWALPKILVMTAVEVERDAVLLGLQNTSGLNPGEFEVRVGGVGLVAAAISTTKALATGNYRMVVSAGIGGCFPNQARLGELVVASKIIAADLGVESLEGFSSLDELGFGNTCIPVESNLVAKVMAGLQDAGLTATAGPIITVATATGTASTAAKLAQRVPGVVAEAMEGYGVALAAADMGLPVLELRAISNFVGPRDREQWQIKEALASLSGASAVLLEVLK